jgi:hypothetical protein
MSESHKSVQQRLEEKQKEARERQLRNLADYEIITADFKDLPQPMPRNFQTHEQLDMNVIAIMKLLEFYKKD